MKLFNRARPPELLKPNKITKTPRKSSYLSVKSSMKINNGGSERPQEITYPEGRCTLLDFLIN